MILRLLGRLGGRNTFVVTMKVNYLAYVVSVGNNTH
jgi:hypothetical protein